MLFLESVALSCAECRGADVTARPGDAISGSTHGVFVMTVLCGYGSRRLSGMILCLFSPKTDTPYNSYLEGESLPGVWSGEPLMFDEIYGTMWQETHWLR